MLTGNSSYYNNEDDDDIDIEIDGHICMIVANIFQTQRAGCNQDPSL